jgi:hypothetical protein
MPSYNRNHTPEALWKLAIVECPAARRGRSARCGKCGSFLYSVVRDGAYVHVALGTLTDEPTIRPSEHIFVRSRAPWFIISDDLPQPWAHVADGPPINR